jgi:hypothetical protein
MNVSSEACGVAGAMTSRILNMQGKQQERSCNAGSGCMVVWGVMHACGVARAMTSRILSVLEGIVQHCCCASDSACTGYALLCVLQ